MSTLILNPALPSSANHMISWEGLSPSGQSLAIAEAASKANSLIVVITRSSAECHRLHRELAFFLANHADLPILLFPDRETLPYDSFSPHRDIISDRLLTLYRLPQTQRGILLVAADTALHYVIPRNFLDTYSFVLQQGEKIDSESLRMRLEQSGYHHVGQVMEHGEYTIRGSIIDLFPMGSPLPFRIDRFGDEVDSIRTFDPDNQRSLDVVTEIKLLPAHEYPLTENAITYFRQSWRLNFHGNPSNSPIYQAISDSHPISGVEYYLPLFYEKLATLFDYLPSSSILIKTGALEPVLNKFWQEIKDRYEQLRHDVTHPRLAPNTLYLPVDQFFHHANAFQNIEIKSSNTPLLTLPVPDVQIRRKDKHPFHALTEFLNQTPTRTLLCAESPGRRESLLDLLKTIAIKPHLYSGWADFLQDTAAIGVTVAPLESGFSIEKPALTLITESQLFGEVTAQPQRRQATKAQEYEALVRDLIELNIGTAVVHVDHGIGRYLGLEIINVDDLEMEFLTLEYAGETKLYVPVSSLHLISRYTGPDTDHVPLHKLGSEQWSKAKRKAATKIRDIAAELLNLYAKRASKTGYAFATATENYLAFASAFPFEETVDQARAINEVMADMQASKVMDRLVCGDVGFGKTEVAMRAAYLAVENSKQVAVLVPTTLLAQQHYESFKDRFADWPVHVDVMSRFRTSKEQTQLLKNVSDGKVDIVIGTHRLLQKDLKFNNLGLLIIDEEHRFGVQQKERLKALRAEVDLLTLTATPIPRTLNMSLSGIRDLSIIATPPARRLAIKTFVHEHDSALIREAILREIHRGGQVYFLHNMVETLDRTLRMLQELVPEARFDHAHGQMHERELERVMADFYHQRFNVLVCTTIIESGIDVPTANTIIMDRADRFGLAQLHQLRGRVGRSHHQAYAYLLVPSLKLLSKDAEKRLDAIAGLEDLGSGFLLATQDLEIRGAGEFLGEEQSGNMQEIGFSLYMEMLERAIESLKAGKEIDDLTQTEQTSTEVDIRVPALIPETYLDDVHTRLIFYKRIAGAQDAKELDELMVEMVDRFGSLQPATKNLLRITEFKLRVAKLGIKRIEATAKQGVVQFAEHTAIKPEKLIMLLQQNMAKYKLLGADKLRFALSGNDKAEVVLDEIAEVIGVLEGIV